MVRVFLSNESLIVWTIKFISLFKTHQNLEVLFDEESDDSMTVHELDERHQISSEAQTTEQLYDIDQHYQELESAYDVNQNQQVIEQPYDIYQRQQEIDFYPEKGSTFNFDVFEPHCFCNFASCLCSSQLITASTIPFFF